MEVEELEELTVDTVVPWGNILSILVGPWGNVGRYLNSCGVLSNYTDFLFMHDQDQEKMKRVRACARFI